jgi:hypothetical protein
MASGSRVQSARAGYPSPVLRARTIVIGVSLFVLAAGGLLLTSCGGSDEASTTTIETTTQATENETTTIESATTETTATVEEEEPVVVKVVVAGGVPKGGIVRETARKGDRVVLVVTSDEADEVHVHGYDLYRDLVPGKAARLVFVAKLPGRFEIELHERVSQIADLTVRP